MRDISTERRPLTAGRIASHVCADGASQSFLWDLTVPHLAVRATAAGSKSFVFQSKYQGSTLRMTIGSPADWSISDARKRARELQSLIDQGRDPRLVQAERIATDVAKQEARRGAAVTVDDAWNAYLRDRRPHWGERHYVDHLKAAREGGAKPKRGRKGGALTVPGPLHSLMATRLRELSPELVEAWAKREAAKRPTTARLAWRLLRGFLSWCAEQPVYKAQLAGPNPARTKKTREAFGTPNARKDVLQREQLPAWFAAVAAIPNRAASVYVRTLLLTGARPGELLSLRWEDVNPQWKAIVIRDKVEGERMIPLTPYVAQLLAGLPRANEWVFASTAAKVVRLRALPAPAVEVPAVRIAVPQKAHARACAAAGVGGPTLHGLRRSFSSLTEWLEIPSGIVAQIMGHKPSATAEKHYKVRPLDLLRLHHERIEAWILEQAGIAFKATEAAKGLRAVV